MYLVVNTDKLPKNKKELAVNIVSIFNDMGVLTASLFSIFATNVILKDRWLSKIPSFLINYYSVKNLLLNDFITI